MYRKLLWFIIIFVIAICAFWYVIETSRDIYHYLQLNICRPTTIKTWSIKEAKSDRFLITAHYFFEYEGKNYEGTGQVGHFYPNPWAASEAVKNLAKQQWSVWLDQTHPERSLLEKHFPIKKTLSAIILILLTCYFLILSFYIKST